LFKQDQLDKIAAKKEGWSAKLAATMKKRPERVEKFAVDSVRFLGLSPVPERTE